MDSGIGDFVNLASRIQDLTRYYKANVIVEENTCLINVYDFVFRHKEIISYFSHRI